MVLHIGSDEFVTLKSVVAVLDVQMHPELMDEVLPKEENGSVSIRKVGTEETKSIVIIQHGGCCVFFLSPISAQTLRRRVQGGLT